ncbi:hypothetical protein CANCADRAFT_102857 [Tortispora caseinolytica NRRL Y-17796]|uniref:Enoyl reductase (ER) domain-containing protein n=1 Tax=Tortispora caseinolytica NRRL Y-17796 TaxID=767744 RepID=A0A1E4TEJ3_9ASCO|nr:hypothetical protein CANCADRAFT_102857 [Tortispora caseinolytica NRRL Y-17796]
MKAIAITKYVSSPFDLKVADVDVPKPGKNQVLVKVEYAGANFFDTLQMQGKYQNQPPFPYVLGAEFSGSVVESNNPAFKPGDKVFGSTQGSYGEYCLANPLNIRKIPKGWTTKDAAGIFVTLPTSYCALAMRANLQPDELVLVHAGAGGVGIYAIQIAKALGAKVIATAGSDSKLDICKKFGADYVVNYSTADWIEEVKKISKSLNRKGVDVVYDPVGLVDKSLKVVGWNSRILVVGFAAGQIESVRTNKFLLKQCSLVGVHWGAYFVQDTKGLDVMWNGIEPLIAKGLIKSANFDTVYQGLQSVPQALSDLSTRKTWGKVAIRVAYDSKL